MDMLYIAGLGSNVAAHRNMAAALDALVSAFGTVAISRVAETAPVAVEGGTFLNAAAAFRSPLPAERLKALFCQWEEAFGRDRSDPDRGRRARTLDVDILLALPGDGRDVDPAALPTAAYHRGAVVELLRFHGLRCPVPAPVADEATAAIPFGPSVVGDAPCWLHRDRTGRSVATRAPRAALVTGGAVRVGREIVRTLAASGYDVAVHYNSSAADAEAAVAECRGAGVRSEPFRADLSDAACLPALMEAVAERFPNLALLVNSASTYEGGAIADTTADVLDRQWAVNFRAPFLLMREFRRLRARGAVVNILDNKIAFNQFHYAAYLTAKKALAEATRMAALEFAPAIRVNGLSPGVVMPAATRNDAYLAWRRDGIPVGHLGGPAELCEGLMLLATNDFINGQILTVDGGEGMAFTGRNAHDFRPAPGQPVTADRQAA